MFLDIKVVPMYPVYKCVAFFQNNPPQISSCSANNILNYIPQS